MLFKLVLFPFLKNRNLGIGIHMRPMEPFHVCHIIITSLSAALWILLIFYCPPLRKIIVLEPPHCA